MDIDWRFQQENARLQKENHKLRKQVRMLGGYVGLNKLEIAQKKEGLRRTIVELSKEEPQDERVFTNGQIEFIHEHDMNYTEVYRLAKKYDSVEEALLRGARV